MNRVQGTGHRVSDIEYMVQPEGTGKGYLVSGKRFKVQGYLPDKKNPPRRTLQ